ncbi:Uncharacterized conserved protein [Chlamydia trachomatis]|nr:Uncharacterized conserved protein [Chlamydia trachomatis]
MHTPKHATIDVSTAIKLAAAHIMMKGSAMVHVLPFAALRPTPENAPTFACPPYDVVTRAQAAKLAPNHRFLHVIRPEISCDLNVHEDDQEAHAHAAAQLTQYEKDGVLIRDPKPTLYIYQQIGYGHIQTGVVGCVRAADYRNGTIKQHEKTLVAKELNRIHHFEATHAQTEPVFLMHQPDDAVHSIVSGATSAQPHYDFTSDNGVRHRFWVLSSDATQKLTQAFSSLAALYIADGHHRSASAVKVAGARGLADDDPRASIMAVLFPCNDLKVLAYNRVVDHLNGLSPEDFLERMHTAGFSVRLCESNPAPCSRGSFGVYIGAADTWYTATFTAPLTGNVISDLDTSILTDHVLTPILGIDDLRTNPHIRFVGGSAGTHGLQTAAGSHGVAFSLYPTSVTDIMAVSDAGKIMPPKSTWFEPKLASGLFIHTLA